MKSSQNGTTIIESIVVMMIIVVWVVGMYNIFIKSQHIASSSSHRVEAIAMAREWIEALTNIRDTNWLLYGVNNKNCWHTLNYSGSCITANGTTNPFTHINTGSYIIYRDTFSNRWHLANRAINGDYSTGTYKNDFRVNLETIGSGNFYTQSGWTNFSPLFTREIKISYLDNENPPQKMKVESIVKWSDNARNGWNYEVKFDTILSNWKK